MGAGVSLAVTVGAAAAHVSERSPYPEISPSEVITWQEHSFEGVTSYELTEADGRTAVHAVCDGAAASGLFYRGEIDLEETPAVEWSWRVDETLSGIDETTKAGDDYPARLYLVDGSSILPWRTRALAIMTDCDHTGERLEAWYGAIRFLPESPLSTVEPGPDG